MSEKTRDEMIARLTWLAPGLKDEALRALLMVAEDFARSASRPLDAATLAAEQRVREASAADADLERRLDGSLARRKVYFCCPGEPKPCIGSGVSSKERACPNCGQWCVPYPSAANLQAAVLVGGRPVPGEVGVELAGGAS